MKRRAHPAALLSGLVLIVLAGSPALADPAALEKARQLLAASNPKQAYMDLVRLEATLAGNVEYDYLLGVAALDSGKLEDAIIAFERILAVRPNHAGARMDISRAYFAAGSYDLAEAGFRKLAESNPPPAAQQAITRYLEAIQTRKRQTSAGWQGQVEVGMGYDDNITGVPSDFGAAAQQSFGIVGIEATGNSIRRRAPFGSVAAGLEYTTPIARGWSAFAGGEVRGRAYGGESTFNSGSGELRGGGALNDGPTQWRLSAGFQTFRQEGEAPGEPKPTNDRRTAQVLGEWKYAPDPKSQVGLGLQYARVRFPDNGIEDFNQVFLTASWLRSFETRGVPMLYLAAFASDDRAVNTMADGETDKSKNLAGLRSYVQYSVTPRLALFNGLGFVYRRDRDAFARSVTVERGRDRFGELLLGLNWQFRKSCAVRTQYAYTRNDSNISLYDFDRNEVSTAVRCEVH